MRFRVVARDGIEPPTPAFSGPRSTTELSGLGVKFQGIWKESAALASTATPLSIAKENRASRDVPSAKYEGLCAARITGRSRQRWVSLISRSMASLARRSASLFLLRRACGIWKNSSPAMRFRLLLERAEVGAFDLVLALDLLDHQLGVRDDAETGIVVAESEFKGREQAGVLGEVVGADAEELA